MNGKNAMMYISHFYKLYVSSTNKHIAHNFEVDAHRHKPSMYKYSLVYEWMHLKSLIEGSLSAAKAKDEFTSWYKKNSLIKSFFFYCKMKDLLLFVIILRFLCLSNKIILSLHST